MKLRKLNSKGITHLIAPLVIVVAVAAVGTFVLVKSHADPVATTAAPRMTDTKNPPIVQLNGPKGSSLNIGVADDSNEMSAQVVLYPSKSKIVLNTATVTLITCVSANKNCKQVGTSSNVVHYPGGNGYSESYYAETVPEAVISGNVYKACAVFASTNTTLSSNKPLCTSFLTYDSH